MKLNLEDLSNIEELTEKYNLNVVNNRYCYDDDLAELFTDSNIGMGMVHNFRMALKIDEDYNPITCNYRDYLETIELKQNGTSYYCPAYCEHNGSGADYALDINNITKEL